MEKLLFVFLTLIISVTVGWLAIPRIVIISKLKKLFDKPDLRKVHKSSIPRLGGVSFFPTMMLSLTMMLGFRYYLDLNLPHVSSVTFLSEFMFLTSSMFIIFFVGLTDDLIGVGYKTKFLAQAIATSLLTFTDIMPTSLHGVLGIYDISTPYAVIFSIILAIYIINAFNLIDGVDGLCSGLSSIVLSALGGWFIYSYMYVYAMIAFGMLGVVLVFFRYNVVGHRMKIFMGDTGSLTLGFLIVFLSFKFIQISSIEGEFYSLNSPVAVIIGLLFIPIFDALRVFTNRIKNKKSPFRPDKTHLHHKLLTLGLSHLKSTKTILIFQIIFLLANILLSEILKLNVNIVLSIDLIVAIFLNSYINKRISYKKLIDKNTN